MPPDPLHPTAPHPAPHPAHHHPHPYPAGRFDAGVVWFRRDLRVNDHAALYHALRQCRRVFALYVFDTAELQGLPRADRRVEFLHAAVIELDADLRRLAVQAGAGPAEACGLVTAQGDARRIVAERARALGAQAVFSNHDDTPAGRERDARVLGALANAGILLQLYKDGAIFERDELLAPTGSAFTAFAPYRRAWLARVDDFFLRPYPVAKHAGALAARPPGLDAPVPTLAALGFERTNLATLALPTGARGAEALFDDFYGRIGDYRRARDFPAVRGPSYLGAHLRAGTVSVRRLAATAHRLALQGNDGAAAWRTALVRRDYFQQWLYHQPQLAAHAARREFDALAWARGKEAERHFAAWCEGRTGYPLVDAGMLQLAATGYMHQRLRGVAAAFLVKVLGIDWRRGEAWFARLLLDAEPGANAGNWQCAAGVAPDAPAWWHVPDPVAQSQRWDAGGRFIRRYLPQLSGLPDTLIHAPWRAGPLELQAAGIVLGRDYPAPVVEHAEAAARTLARYAAVAGEPPGRGRARSAPPLSLR